MNQRLRHPKSQFIVIVTLIFMMVSVHGEGTIGVTPATITFNDVLRGGYAEQTITITASSETVVNVEIEARGDIAAWLGFEKQTFSVSKNNPYVLKINVTPPIDVANNNYTGFIRVRASNTNIQTENNAATGIIIPVIDLYTIVSITDVEYRTCRALEFQVNSVEEGEALTFQIDVENTGNVRLNPRIDIEIWDIDQTTVVRSHEFSGTTIIPTTRETITVSVPSNGLELGQYWVEVSALECRAQQTLTFDLLEEGTLRASGILETINTRHIINVGETTLIEPVFRNNGEKDVEAYFKGRITLSDKTIQLIETERQIVPKGEVETFELYFTPSKTGRYVVSGRVYYDNKRTFEKSVIISTISNGITVGRLIQFTIYIVLIVGIVYVSHMIRQEKRRYQQDLRRLRA